MELRAFAEQVLFATSLEEKLRDPGDVTDECPGPALATPDAPGRPRGLEFKATGAARDQFPGTRELENEHHRGRLLHFFANHELLATELMALVLLRFPDAPAAFRKGVFRTLKDEQEHTRLYMERMQGCGITLGDLPVSGYFWRTVSGMESPIDYVSSLCLTFEQANLDFAGHYGGHFAQVGDAASAALLNKIYHDEIGHVAYGLKWFRRWKNPTESDWDAFCRVLKFPLSPQRAKGFTLNVAGRLAAGLEPEFIARLDVYSQSKGRTPSVFVFNPFAEGRLAEGKTFNPTKPQAQLARDLENLPQFLCRQDDLMLVRQAPSITFLSGLKQAGFHLPEFVELATTGAPLPSLATRKLGCLRPWAWGPDSLDLLAPLFNNVTGEKRAAEKRFNSGLAELYSKAWSADFLRRILANAPPEIQTAPWLCPEKVVGMPVTTMEAALAAVAVIRARGHHPIIIKAALGVAGSNAMRFFEPEMLETQKRWLANAFAQNRVLVVEPWLERELDFSIQLEMTVEGLKLRGYTGLLNDARGQFQANFAEPHHHKRIPARVIARFPGPPDISNRLLAFYANVFRALEAELHRADFLGPIGIDAFVYRDAAGAVRLKPVVEINPRYTMGRVLVELMHQTWQGSHGLFRLVNPPSLRATGDATFTAYAQRMTAQYPLQFEGQPVPRIREGFLCLNDPLTAQVCLATFQVAKNLAALLGN